jgi:hypothetical protein
MIVLCHGCNSANRFRILKMPLMLDELADMRHLFVTCCVFHNMLLDHDAASMHNEASDPSFGQHHPDVLGTTYSARDFAESSTTTPDVVVHENLDVSGAGGMNDAPINSAFFFRDASPEDGIPLYFHDGSSQPTHYALRNALATHVSLDEW